MVFLIQSLETYKHLLTWYVANIDIFNQIKILIGFNTIPYSYLPLLCRQYFLTLHLFTPSLFEELTNLQMLKQRRLTRNACDRSKQVAICSQIRTYLAFSYYINKQILTHLSYLFYFPSTLHNTLKPCFSRCKSIGFSTQKLCF